MDGTGRIIRTKMRIEDRTEILSLDDLIRSYRDENRFLPLCQACRNYGTCWSCPPYDFRPEDFLSDYTVAELMLEIVYFEDENMSDKESFAILADVKKELYPRLLDWEKTVPGSRVFCPGSCINCGDATCARISGRPCCHPDRMRYSLESFGFDVEAILRDIFGMKLLWAEKGKAPAYYALVSALLR